MNIPLNENQLSNIEETLEDFKALLPRYRKLNNQSEKLKKFFVRNRNPLWDISNAKFFKTGLKSDGCETLNDLVDDHYIQRSKAIKFIFSELDKNEKLNLNEFILLLRKFCSTVKLTKDEHNKVTQIAKQNPDYLNYEIYSMCNIKVQGLSDLILG